MAEPARLSPFTRLIADASGSRGGVTIAECRGRALVTIAGPSASDAFTASVRAAIGAELPREPGHVAAARLGWTCWTGPDEWLFVAPGGDGAAIEDELLGAVAPIGGKIVDISHGRAIVRLGGARSRDLLAKFCPIDVTPHGLPPGRCAQTLFGKINLLLHALADGSAVELYVSRSYADAFADALLAGAREYGVMVGAPVA